MSLDIMSFGRAFAPRMVAKFLNTIDKASVIIVSVSWGGAVTMMLIALYTVHLSVVAKKDVVEAAAKEPSLPVINMTAPRINELEPLVARLERRFPDITFNLARDLAFTVTASDGNHFRTWLTVLSYIDTISPDFRWQIRELCVGLQCGAATPMRAVLIPRKITFTSSG